MRGLSSSGCGKAKSPVRKRGSPWGVRRRKSVSSSSWSAPRSSRIPHPDGSAATGRRFPRRGPGRKARRWRQREGRGGTSGLKRKPEFPQTKTHPLPRNTPVVFPRRAPTTSPSRLGPRLPQFPPAGRTDPPPALAVKSAKRGFFGLRWITAAPITQQ